MRGDWPPLIAVTLFIYFIFIIIIQNKLVM